MLPSKRYRIRKFPFAALLFVVLGPLATAQVRDATNHPIQRDLPTEWYGVKRIVRFSRLPDAKVLDLRSWQYTTIDLAKPGPIDVVVFLSASDPVSTLSILPGLKRLSGKYRPDELSESFCFVRTNQQNAILLANSGLFGETAELYWDNKGEVDRLLGLPSVTPFGAVIEGGTRRLIIPLENNPAILNTVEYFVQWKIKQGLH
jgi:hypothetical protein